ncbi:hypothetical protein BX661DRAFT_91772 [Kickxella alabastrina]|uniref:uncharacterized protein n=1 Tax=Kickxella alabastrina TaxID=61397 RepID=UPI00221F0F0E|nr:uncharacterized protein BX661DRAFT_91772 [Kickxella alabastrina]KAI7831004.1 hypothetical protein BX661DRAFT_91772 [Kickxella alabastrina]
MEGLTKPKSKKTLLNIFKVTLTLACPCQAEVAKFNHAAPVAIIQTKCQLCPMEVEYWCESAGSIVFPKCVCIVSELAAYLIRRPIRSQIHLGLEHKVDCSYATLNDSPVIKREVGLCAEPTISASWRSSITSIKPGALALSSEIFLLRASTFSLITVRDWSTNLTYRNSSFTFRDVGGTVLKTSDSSGVHSVLVTSFLF